MEEGSEPPKKIIKYMSKFSSRWQVRGIEAYAKDACIVPTVRIVEPILVLHMVA